MRLARRYRNYVGDQDRLVETSNSIAMMVAASQPFYPLYVWWIVGADAWPALFTLLSTPLFLAVPALARANGMAGRALLPLAGIANTTLAAALLSPQAGAQLFLGPCLLIATMQFRRAERWAGFAIVALATAAYLAVPDIAGTVSFAASEAARLVTLHAVGAGTLTVLAGLWFSDAIGNPSVASAPTPPRPDSRRQPKRP